MYLIKVKSTLLNTKPFNTASYGTELKAFSMSIVIKWVLSSWIHLWAVWTPIRKPFGLPINWSGKLGSGNLELMHLWNTFKMADYTQIGLHPPFAFGMRVTLNKYRFGMLVIISGLFTRRLHMFLSVWMNPYAPYLLTTCFKNSFLIASNPTAFPDLEAIIAYFTSSSVKFITDPYYGVFLVIIFVGNGAGNFWSRISVYFSRDGNTTICALPST